MLEREIGMPGGLPISERRRFIRHSLCFPLTYKIVEHRSAKEAAKDKESDEAGEGKSTTINIGMGGLLFAARRPVTTGSIIMIKMPFQDKIFNVRAKVVRCDRNLETKFFNIGASFHRLSAAYKVKLVEQLYLISEFRDLKSIELGRDISLERASREWIKRYSERFRKLYW